MWCGTYFPPNGTRCAPRAATTRPAAYSTARLISSGCAGLPSLSGQVLLQPADVGGQAAPVGGRLADDRGARGPDDAEQQGGVDRPGGVVGVPVPAQAQ